MYIQIPPEIKTLPIPELYLVGGCVRDTILGRVPHDIDAASAVMPDEAAAITGGTVVNRRLGTVLIDALGTKIEHTTFRTESYGEGGAHTPAEVTLGATMEQDAYRRDFTAGALYARASDGLVIDPTGKGLCDIKRRLLRTTTDDPALIIRDDALRMLRMARFAAQLGFRVDRGLFNCVRENASKIRDISPERVFGELMQILTIDARGGGGAVRKALILLSASGLLFHIFPEFEACASQKQGKYHKYNVLRHCIETAEAAPCDKTLRLAALLHDIGKPAAVAARGNMYGHEIIGAEIAHTILTRLRAPKALCDDVCRLIRWHMYDLTASARPKTLRRALQKLGIRDFERLAALRRADITGSAMGGSTLSAERFEAAAAEAKRSRLPLSASELAINGSDIILALGVRPGPEIGYILGRLLEMCAEHPDKNRPEPLLAYARQLVRSLKAKEKH